MNRIVAPSLLLIFFTLLVPATAQQTPACDAEHVSGVTAIRVSGTSYIWTYRAVDGLVCIKS